MHRLLFIVLVFVMVSMTTPVLAQEETPSWCPLNPVDPEPAGELVITYVKNGNVFLYTEDGNSTALVETGDVTAAKISDDGQIVAFVRQTPTDHYELWAINSDATNQRLLVSADQIANTRPAENFPFTVGFYNFDWIPNTYTIAFNTSTIPSGDGLYIQIADDLWTVDADTQTLTQLLGNGEGGTFSYSPDGNFVAIMRPDSLDVMNTDGSNRRVDVLESFAAIGFGEYYVFPQIVWAGDHFVTAIVASDDPYSQTSTTIAVWSIPLQDKAPSQLSTFTAFYPAFHISPDLSLVMYWRATETNQREFHLARLDGSEEVIYAVGEFLDTIGWLSDSQRFLFRASAEGILEIRDICGGTQSALLPQFGWVRLIDQTRALISDGIQLTLIDSTGTTTLLGTDWVAYDFTVLPKN